MVGIIQINPLMHAFRYFLRRCTNHDRGCGRWCCGGCCGGGRWHFERKRSAWCGRWIYSIESNNKVHSAHSAHQSHSPLTADVDTSRVQQRDDAVNWVASFFGGSRSSWLKIVVIRYDVWRPMKNSKRQRSDFLLGVRRSTQSIAYAQTHKYEYGTTVLRSQKCIVYWI